MSNSASAVDSVFASFVSTSSISALSASESGSRKLDSASTRVPDHRLRKGPPTSPPRGTRYLISVSIRIWPIPIFSPLNRIGLFKTRSDSADSFNYAYKAKAAKHMECNLCAVLEKLVCRAPQDKPL